LAGTYKQVMELGFGAIVQLSPDEQAEVEGNTAARFYKIQR